VGLLFGAIAASCSLLTPTGDLTGGQAPEEADASHVDASEDGDAAKDQASDAPIDHAPPATCENKMQDTNETDVDCGGVCGKCGNGRKCKGPGDCQSGDCLSSVCATASCHDMIRNGAETDVDCGGGTCAPCANGKACLTVGDCVNLLCEKGACAIPTCTDHVKDGTETDVDCGGIACVKCEDEKSCVAATDCASAVCAPDPNMSIPKCQPCDDGKLDGTESDVDCGGGLCKPCTIGKTCVGANDCASGECQNGRCKSACGDECAGPTDCLSTCPCNLAKKLCGM
jgi:hypothetical protein